MGKPATRMLTRKEADQGEILGQELGLGEADIGDPVVSRRIPNLVDPDTLALIGEFVKTILDQAHLSWCDVRHDDILLKRDRTGCASIPKTNIYL